MSKALKVITKHSYDILALILACFFVITRSMYLPQTLEFFSDMGRDLYVVQQAVNTFRPPLLGPSTSTLPINQSAWYFYSLVPVFLLTKQSAYTTVISGILLFLIGGAIIWFQHRKNDQWRGWIALIFFLVALHPEFITQTRSPWNPTFAVIGLLVALSSWVKITIDRKFLDVFLFAGASTFAIACSYSTIPVVALLTLVLIINPTIKNETKIHIIGLLLAWTVFWFLPTIIFELRHDLLLTKSLLSYTPTTTDFGIVHDMFWMSVYLTGAKETQLMFIGTVTVVVCLGWNLHTTWLSKHPQDRWFRTFLTLLFSACFLQLLAPFGMQNHYVLPLSAVLFFTVALLRKTVKVAIIGSLFILWLHPLQVQQYFIPAKRTVEELESCAKTICSQYVQPTFVSVQAWHNYHYAPDYLFMFNKHGCTSSDILSTQKVARVMLVVADQSTFKFGRDDFHEISVFGNATETNVVECPGNISVHVLQK